MEDLFLKGKEIEENLQKELYCNKKDRPREIFNAIKWWLLLQLLVIIAYIYMLYTCDDFGTGVLWTLLFIGAPWPIYVNLFKKAKQAKQENDECADYIKKTYQDTFDAFIFANQVEQVLFTLGFAHGEKDTVNPDEETKHFYKYDSINTLSLRYEYSDVKSVNVFGYKGFSFYGSSFIGKEFWYQTLYGVNLRFKLPKNIGHRFTIIRNGAFYDPDVSGDISNLKTISLDNSQFTNRFTTYATDTIEAFKLMTPSYMEKLLRFSEKYEIRYITVVDDELIIHFDSNYPTLQNPVKGYDVQIAINNAVAVAQNFFQFIQESESLWK